MTIQLVRNKENWNPKDVKSFVPFTQEWFYSEWQNQNGKEIFHIKGVRGDKDIFYAQVLKTKFLGNKSYLYCPYGPVVSKDINEDDKKEFIDFVSDLAKKDKAVFVRFDNNIFSLPEMKYSKIFQPASERVINIESPIEDILKSMDKNIRYSINLAKKSGVSVSIVSEDLLSHFDELYETFSLSAKRNDIGLHPKEYYKKILEVGEIYKNVFLTFTRHEGKILVASLTVMAGNRATQIFSGSTDVYRNLRPAAITRLESINYAKSRGMSEFSLGGVSSDVYPVKEWAGISEFKKQFGGKVEISANPGVLVFMPIWFGLYNLKKIFR